MEIGQLDTAIKISNITKDFNNGMIKALGPISFDISRGEFVSIVGPSGCGKSTLLKILAGLMEQTDGSITIGDKVISGPSTDVGIAFQAPTLLPWRTVIKNIMLPLTVNGVDDKYSKNKAQELIELVGLKEFSDRFPHELSGGMQQRVAIARALVTKPKVLLMDEPFGALDEFTRETMNEELLRIWERDTKTIVFITHSIEEAVFMSDRVVVMSARPGIVSEIIDINLERPRKSEMRQDNQMFELIKTIRRVLYPTLENVNENEEPSFIT